MFSFSIWRIVYLFYKCIPGVFHFYFFLNHTLRNVGPSFKNSKIKEFCPRSHSICTCRWNTGDTIRLISQGTPECADWMSSFICSFCWSRDRRLKILHKEDVYLYFQRLQRLSQQSVKDNYIYRDSVKFDKFKLFNLLAVIKIIKWRLIFKDTQ